MQSRSPYFCPFKNNTFKLIYEIITKKPHIVFFSFHFTFILLKITIYILEFTLYILIIEPQEISIKNIKLIKNLLLYFN